MTHSTDHVASRESAPTVRPRRGAALLTTMMFVGAIGGVALASVYLAGNANLVSKSYDKEAELKYVAEAGLALGKARLNFDPAALPNTAFVALMMNKTIPAADNKVIPGVVVNVYAGPTGSTSGQFGRFASVVAEAKDSRGMGFVRRLELSQESFAKFAYWTNSEVSAATGAVIYFGGGDQLWGPVWSNDVIHLLSTGATFNDEVGTAKTVENPGYGTWKKGYKENQKVINLPSTSSLSTLSAIATVSGWNFVAPTTGSETTVRMRIEFVAADMNADTDSLDADEGFFRVYTVPNGQEAWLRGDWPGAGTPANILNCGDWHPAVAAGPLKFFPVAVHNTAWFKTILTAQGWTNGNANAEQGASAQTIMGHAGARCYPGGAPQLVAIARNSGAWTNAQKQKGGDDTTFTATDVLGGVWSLYSNTPNANVTAKRPADAKYLFPTYRGLHPTAKGVIYTQGTVAISGTVRSLITLYAQGNIVIIDDVRYANDPSKGVCLDMLGLLTDKNIIIADNGINTPQDVTGGGVYQQMDDTKDLYLHAVTMSLGTSFTVQNYNGGPNASNNCDATVNGRGCLYLAGGIIQTTRGAVGLSTGQGYTKRYSYDRCAVINPPPYFPTTGRFTDNRYYEMDPIGFNVNKLFLALTPDK